MADPFAKAIFCGNIGQSPSSTEVNCCYANNQTTYFCNEYFNVTGQTFYTGCDNSNCLAVCQRPERLYRSDTQDDPQLGNNQAPKQRFLTCLNVPAMAGFAARRNLSEEIASLVGKHVPSDASPASLQSVTSVATECLTQTCKASRNQVVCSEACSAVNMLKSPTMPDIRGVNECLHQLCNGSYNSLPYADADVVGIGVFSSYIMQCILVALLWLGLFLLERKPKHATQTQERAKEKHASTTPPSRHATPHADSRPGNSVPSKAEAKEPTHQSLLETCLVQFHVSQCYFSATIQVASLSYGIFSPDLLVTFLLIPLSVNGVLPVVFGFALLFRHGRDSPDVTLLTTACWLLSSLVFWALYSNIIPVTAHISTEERRNLAYQQLTYKLTALRSCGGYSALAVCPKHFSVGREDLASASHKLIYITPILWSLATVSLLALLAAKAAHRHPPPPSQPTTQTHHPQEQDGSRPPRQQPDSPNARPESPLLDDAQTTPGAEPRVASFRSRRWFSVAWGVGTAVFLVGLGVQLSLLSISTSLKMVNGQAWGFGQIVAVAVWVPPLLQYAYGEVEKGVGGLGGASKGAVAAVTVRDG